MSKQTTSLGQLERLARIRSDIEMRRFSAFRQHVEAAQARISGFERDLNALYDAETGFSVAEARLANALAQNRMRALLQARQELAQMMPGYEAARARAQQEFGRTEVLGTLRRQSQDEDKAAHERKLGPPP